MSTVVIRPRLLQGRVTPPPSKSMAHRCLIAAALSEQESKITNLADSQDMIATRGCLAALKQGGEELPLLDCGESGSTLRFLIPVALALRGGGRFVGRGRLMERPQKPYFDLFDEKGIAYAQKDGVLTVQGTLTAGKYALPGNVSSQFITGLLYALPLLEGTSEIVLTTPLESSGYVDMTLEVLEQFGIQVACQNYERFVIHGGQKYQARNMTVEADWSQAAFWYSANALGSTLEVAGLNTRSTQGDKVVAEQFRQLTQPGDVVLDVSQCPDLVPALAVQAALRADETTCIVGAARLRIKESDRLDAVTCELSKLGAQITQAPDSLTIHGVTGFHGGTTDSRNDHRIAMMLAVAATRADNNHLAIR